MKKQKLNLEQLSVISFISSIPKGRLETIRGGNTDPIIPTPPASPPEDDGGSAGGGSSETVNFY